MKPTLKYIWYAGALMLVRLSPDSQWFTIEEAVDPEFDWFEFHQIQIPTDILL